MLDFLRNLTKSAEEKRQERLNAYLDGELAPGEQRQFEQEMAEDTALRAEVEELRWTKTNVQRLPRLRAPRNFTLDPAVYGQTAPGRAWQAYPALRVATALTAFFFALAFVMDLLTPAGALDQPALRLLQGGEARVAETESTADEAAAEVEEAAEPEIAMQEAPAEEPEAEALEAPAEEEALAQSFEITRTLEAEQAEAPPVGDAAEQAAEEVVEAEVAESEDGADRDATVTRRAAAPAASGGQITATEEIAGLAPSPTLAATIEAVQPEVATETAPPTLPPSTLPATAVAGDDTEITSEPPQPPQPFPYLLVLEVALGVALAVLVGVMLIVRRNL